MSEYVAWSHDGNSFNWNVENGYLTSQANSTPSITFPDETSSPLALIFTIPANLFTYPVSIYRIDIDFTDSISCAPTTVDVYPPLATRVVIGLDQLPLRYSNIYVNETFPTCHVPCPWTSKSFSLSVPMVVGPSQKSIDFYFFNRLCSSEVINVRNVTFYLTPHPPAPAPPAPIPPAPVPPIPPFPPVPPPPSPPTPVPAPTPAPENDDKIPSDDIVKSWVFWFLMAIIIFLLFMIFILWNMNEN